MIGEDESDYTEQFVAQVVNADPIVEFGMTDAEIKSVAFAGLGIGLVLGVTGAVFIHPLFIALIILLPAVFVPVAGKYVAKLRKGKPRAYFAHYLDAVLKKDSFSTTYAWTLGRTQKRRPQLRGDRV